MGDKTPTTDQLRSAIDSGRTGEKVDFPDPAAAPLGTDAEAAGEPPTESERKVEARARPRAQGADQDQDRGMVYYLGLVASAYVLVLGVGLLAMMMR